MAGINHADSGTDDRCAGTFRFWLSVHPRGYGGAVAGISVRASADASRENTTKPDCGWWNSLPSRDRRAGRDTSGRRGGDGDLYRQAQRHTIPSNSLVNAKNRNERHFPQSVAVERAGSAGAAVGIDGDNCRSTKGSAVAARRPFAGYSAGTCARGTGGKVAL